MALIYICSGKEREFISIYPTKAEAGAETELVSPL